MAANERPNILLIFTDQHRFDFLGPVCPHPLPTPNLDQLARRSLNFTAAYSPAPVCGPARTSFFTGRYPPAHGAVRNWMPMLRQDPLLSEQLADVYYQTALIGKLHLHPATQAHGFEWRRICDSPHGVYDAEELVDNPYRRWIERECFNDDPEAAEEAAGRSERLPIDDPGFWIGDSWCDDAHHMTSWTGDQAIRFLTNERDGRPFFLNVSFFGPHHPYATCEPWDSLIDPTDIDLPEDFPQMPEGPVLGPLIREKRKHFKEWHRTDWKRAIALYCGAIAQIDREVGRILNALEAAELAENTLIVFTADHGDNMSNLGVCGKGNFSECASRVPLLISPPGGAERASVCPAPVNLLDLRATIADYADLGPDATLDGFPGAGHSLRPCVEGPNEISPERATFSINSERTPESMTAMIRRGPLKLIRGPGIEPRHELIDLRAEPYDHRPIPFNPHGDSGHRALREELDAFYQYHFERFPRL